MEVETMEEKAENYFASMSHLANKIMQYNESIKEMYRDTWNGLSWEKQEQLLDQHVINPKIADKYSSYRIDGEPPCFFPVLKINSGEKIVVDFEHDDGWTWTDEHSAPFSWKTKSQQDLTLADIDDAGNGKEEANKKSRPGKKSRSPDRSMFDSLACNGDRSKNEVEKMFEKFGIKVQGYSDDETEEKNYKTSHEVIAKDPESTASPSHLYNECSKLLDDSSDLLDNKDSFGSDAKLFVGAIETKVMRNSTTKQNDATTKTKVSKNKSQGGGKKEKGKNSQEKGKGTKEKTNKKKKISTSSTDPIIQNQQPCVDKISFDCSLASPSEKQDAELSFISETTQPIRFTEIGESSTDDLQENVKTQVTFEPNKLMFDTQTNDVFDYAGLDDKTTVVTSQPKMSEVTMDAPLMLSSEFKNESFSVVKTGFDFLDNW